MTVGSGRQSCSIPTVSNLTKYHEKLWEFSVKPVKKTWKGESVSTQRDEQSHPWFIQKTKTLPAHDLKAILNNLKETLPHGVACEHKCTSKYSIVNNTTYEESLARQKEKAMWKLLPKAQFNSETTPWPLQWRNKKNGCYQTPEELNRASILVHRLIWRMKKTVDGSPIPRFEGLARRHLEGSRYRILG